MLGGVGRLPRIASCGVYPSDHENVPLRDRNKVLSSFGSQPVLLRDRKKLQPKKGREGGSKDNDVKLEGPGQSPSAKRVRFENVPTGYNSRPPIYPPRPFA